jgi:hypothetical protein
VVVVEALAVSDVSDLLALSQSAHTEYQQNMPRQSAQGIIPGNPELARAALQQAYDLRAQADSTDPDHLDPAWLMDRAPHATLMAFYTNQMTKADEKEAARLEKNTKKELAT